MLSGRILGLSELERRGLGLRSAALAGLSSIALNAGLAHAAEVAPAVATDPSAASNASVSVAEVLVTARRRVEKAQSVPIAITNLSAKDLATHQEVKLAQDVVAFAPNVTAAATDGRERPRWFIRGVGTNNTDANGVSQVGVYRDDVYIANFYAQAFPLFDQSQVDVLSGPQGTLWGKNTTGGAISFTSKAPSFTPSGYVKADVGSFGEWGAEGAVGGPIVGDVLAGRLSLYHDQDKGWMKNVYKGDVLTPSPTAWNTANPKSVGANDETDLRAQFLFKPSNSFDALLSVHHRRYFGDSTPSYEGPDTPNAPLVNPSYNLGYTSPSNPLPYGYVWAADVGRESVDNTGGLVRLNWVLPDDVTLTSITGYEDSALRRSSGGNPAIPLSNSVSRQFTPDKQFSEEVRFASPLSGRFNWIAGAYYFNEREVSEAWAGNLVAFTAPSPVTKASYSDTYTATKTQSGALFGSATYNFTDKFKLTAGGRLNSEKKIYGQAYTQGTGTVAFSNPGQWWNESSVSSPLLTNSVAQISQTYNSFTFDITPQYAITDKALAYLHVATGYLSGGFDSKKNTGVTPNTQQINAYAPERLTAYQLGLKTSWFDSRLIANAELFYYDYPSIQVLVILPSSGSNSSSSTSNIGQGYSNAAGWVRGAEFTLNATPDEHWHLRAALGLLDSKYTSYPLQTGVSYPGLGITPATVINPTGGVFTRAPKVTASLAADYTLHLPGGSSLQGGLQYQYLSKQYYNPTLEFDPTLSQGAYGLVNGHVTWSLGAENRYAVTLTGLNLTDQHYLIHAIAPSNFVSAEREGKPRSFLLTVSAKY